MVFGDRGGLAANWIGKVTIAQAAIHTPPRAPVVWPVQVGTVPLLASAFQTRPELRHAVEATGESHTPRALTQVLSGGGGVGKTQLAAASAHQALAEGTELVVWVDATETERVIALYARAAQQVQAAGAQGLDAEADARAFMEWLATTSRSWLVVLDDITDPEDIGEWWPAGRPGGRRVVATTRRRDTLLSGSGRMIVNLGAYTPAQAVAYLRERLTDMRATHLLDDTAEELAQELGHLPLALAHAAAYVINEDVSCAHYLQRFADRRSSLSKLLPRQADTEGYGRPVTTALLLALDAAQKCEPVGLATPAIRLAAHLDTAGHPADLWATSAAIDYLTAQRPPLAGAEPVDVDTEQARAALRLLHRYGLITCDSIAGPRAVRLHTLTARAARETTPASDTPATVRAAADALAEIWPEADHTDPDLTAVLRANTDTLTTHAADVLWSPDGHSVLYRAGVSLITVRLYAAAITHWQRLATDSERLLGHDHADTVSARVGLGMGYVLAGRSDEALPLLERTVAENEQLPAASRLLGARMLLALCYQLAGRSDEALPLLERAVTESEQLLDATGILGARMLLAFCYQPAGRSDEALALMERAVADCEQSLGPDNPHTLRARMIMALYYCQAGRTDEALILMLERVVADCEQLLGPDNPDTLGARMVMGLCYCQAGRTDEGVTLMERAVADCEQLLGPDHVTTLGVQGGLVDTYWEAGRTDEAIPLLERVVADYEQALGPGRLTTWKLRANLAVWYWEAGRTDEGVTLMERVVASYEQLLGPDHRDTIGARMVLGLYYQEVGRTDEALADFTRAIELDPDDSAAVAGRGLTCLRMGRFDEALADFTRAIELDATYAWAVADRGETYLRMGRFDEALADLTRAIELDATYAWAVANRGETYLRMERFDEAEADFTRAIELDPDDSAAVAGRGLTYQLLGRFDEALADFTRAIELDPDEGVWHYQIAVTLRLLARPEEHEHWRRAEEIFAAQAAEGVGSARARGNLFILHCAVPDWEEAAGQLDRFLHTVPGRGLVREALDDLRELQELLNVAPERLEPLRGRLEDALAETNT
ncbi:tetratricopeptide repeat protein [Streptomyces sp. NPDC060064]|uniref:tetratricopeptide repeat protein n=1 Tax=Streptomyces sp. NPDC060064 TaxID=3347049 RepID=UPI0036A9781A